MSKLIFYILFITIVSIFFSCVCADLKNTCSVFSNSNSSNRSTNRDLNDKSIDKRCLLLTQSLIYRNNDANFKFDLSEILNEFSTNEFTKKLAQEQYEKYNAKEWISEAKIRFNVPMMDFSSDFLSSNDGCYYQLKSSNIGFSCELVKCLSPDYAAKMLFNEIMNNSIRPNFIAQKYEIDIGNCMLGKIMSKIVNTPSKDEFCKNYIKDSEVDDYIKQKKEYYVSQLFFIRDNYYCVITPTFGHNPMNEEYNVYDFSKEVDEFIQKQPTVDKFKPATLKFTFENYNIDTYKWESAEEYLQASYIDTGTGELPENLVKQIQKKLGIIDENNVLDWKKRDHLRPEYTKYESNFLYPMRMKIKITDQLGNRGGNTAIVGIFHGQADAEIPEPLTIESLQKVYDIETEKGIEDSKISWFNERWACTERFDRFPDCILYGFPVGRYIIVIDVTTNSNVKSRHFYELKVENKKTD